MMEGLSLSRAARLAGVTRAELQARIRRGEIATFEGSVSVEDLLRAYPAVTLQDDSALERVERIKRTALPKTDSRDTVLPSAQVLLARLHAMSESLSERMATLSTAEALLDRVEERLGALTQAPLGEQAEQARALADWLRAARQAVTAGTPAEERARLLAKDAFLRIMAANVRLIPSGHDYFVEGSESILDASVRAGLNLNYGCASGNCGACKARLIQGETRRIRDHDYVLSEREKRLGYLLTCSHTAVTDLVIEAAEALSVKDLPQQRIRASLRAIEPLSSDLLTLHIQTPRTQTLRFMSGQRARLTLEDGATRELSIASCPCNGRNLWFFVRRGADDFSASAFGSLRPGQMIEIEGPHGDFVLTEDAPEPAVFVAFGDGIAPIKSLIEHAVSIDLIESFSLYWDNAHPEGHHQERWCRALRDALDNFAFTHARSDDPAELFAMIQADHHDLAPRRFYLAGPLARIEPLTVLLEEAGVAPGNIISEPTPT